MARKRGPGVDPPSDRTRFRSFARGLKKALTAVANAMTCGAIWTGRGCCQCKTGCLGAAPRQSDVESRASMSSALAAPRNGAWVSRQWISSFGPRQSVGIRAAAQTRCASVFQAPFLSAQMAGYLQDRSVEARPPRKPMTMRATGGRTARCGRDNVDEPTPQ